MTAETRRILLVHLGSRGAGPRFTLEMARALAERGTPCAVLLSGRNVMLEEFRELSGPLYIVGGQRYTPATPFQVRAGFRRAVREWQPTDVWSGMGHPLDLCGLAVVKRARIPYTLVVHDGDPHPGDRSWLRRVNEREVGMADVIVTLSAHVSSAVRQRWPNQPVLELWHPPFAGKTPDASSAQRRRNGKRGVLFFGRILPYKGLELLLDAGLLLQARNVPFELTIVGEGPLTAAEVGKVGRLGATLVNRFVGEAEAAACFNACDVVVLPYIEASQSGVVASAIGHGKPVIATPVGGLGDQVRSQRAGLVIPNVTAQALADALARVCRDDEFLAGLSRETLPMRMTFDWQAWTERMLNSQISPARI